MFFVNRKIMSMMCLALIWSLPATVSANSEGNNAYLEEAALENQQGLKFFKHGYYNLMPHGRSAEARQNLQRAEKAFQKAISINGNFIEAHRNLARLYYLQKRFDQAALEYAHVLRLDPADIDIYVHMALAQVELGQWGEAIRYLETAKAQTSENRIIQQLDGYISKVRQMQ